VKPSFLYPRREGSRDSPVRKEFREKIRSNSTALTGKSGVTTPAPADQAENTSTAAAEKVYSVISGILYALLFPYFNFRVFFPVFLIPLLISLSSKKGFGRKRYFKKVILYPLFAGVSANLIIHYWIPMTLRLNGTGIYIAYAAYFIMAVYLGLYWVLFSVLCRALLSGKTAFPALGAAALWVAVEWMRANVPVLGFPWLLTAYSVWDIKEALWPLSIIGIYGLGFIIALLNALIARAISAKKPLYLFPAVLLVAAVYVPGRMIKSRELPEGNTSVCVIQANIPQYRKWDRQFYTDIITKYTGLRKRAQELFRPELTVWPETALPGPFGFDEFITDTVTELKKELGPSLDLIGSTEKENGKYYNSALLIDGESRLLGTYRKTHLVPFGEYIPARSLLSRFISVVNDLGDFFPGKDIKPLEAGKFRLGAVICFEGIFPGISREYFRKGANLLINMTNDGWYLRTAAPEQHLLHYIYRSVENNTYTVRAANTGVSCLINPQGDIVFRTDLMKTMVFHEKKIGLTEQMTFYTRYGDGPALLFIGLIILSALFRKKGGKQGV
jgi:apolipoprotein N-acyltransferase